MNKSNEEEVNKAIVHYTEKMDSLYRVNAELLEALEDCVDEIESTLGLMDFGCTRERDWPSLVKARAVIRKVRGDE